MSYLAVCTFDLANASGEDYEMAYKELARIGLKRSKVSDKGRPVKLPTTTTAGEFEGADAGAIRDDIISRIKRAFVARRLKAEIFVSVGGDWAWGHRKT